MTSGVHGGGQAIDNDDIDNYNYVRLVAPLAELRIDVWRCVHTPTPLFSMMQLSLECVLRACLHFCHSDQVQFFFALYMVGTRCKTLGNRAPHLITTNCNLEVCAYIHRQNNTSEPPIHLDNPLAGATSHERCACF